VVVVFVIASLLVGAVAISLNIKLEEQESALPPLAHR
jgi:putative exporter of polyketide antibiotics